MPTIATYYTQGFADWETTFLNAVARGFYGVTTLAATPDGAPVTSMGGLVVTPDCAAEALDMDAIDALVICGGTIWVTPQAPDIAALAQAAHRAGKLVAGICDGTLALARTGLLDNVAHTGSGKEHLATTGYGGTALYREAPGAVADGSIITAASTAPVDFMVNVLEALNLGDAQLRHYAGLHAAQHRAA